MPKGNRPHGHYCKICGQYKANEKFSGKGHAAHICKTCSRLSSEEKAAAMDVNRIMALSMRRLSDSEKKWLEKKMQDDRQEVADAAREACNIRFPYAERNAMKKQLVINHLLFEVHAGVYDEACNKEIVERRFTIDRKNCRLAMTDFCDGNGEQSVILDGGRMKKLVRYIVHTLEIFMWEQDYPLHPDGDDFLMDVFSEDDFDADLPEEGDTLKKEPEGNPCWRVQVEYSNHMVQDFSGYGDYLPDRPEELYFSLLEYFEPEEEEWD